MLTCEQTKMKLTPVSQVKNAANHKRWQCQWVSCSVHYTDIHAPQRLNFVITLVVQQFSFYDKQLKQIVHRIV